MVLLFALLLAFRAANALALRTFFQPDEFFQSLEPAWRLAFGDAAHACITWEWTQQLRSSLHPALFAAAYRAAAALARLARLRPPRTADLLLAAPKLTQALAAALLDYSTCHLARRTYGRDASRPALAALALSLASPWNWFCSTRTLSNCLETTLSAIAVCYWPWHWPGTATPHQPAALRLSLLLAALACVLRPTNLLIWLALALPTLWSASGRRRFLLAREILLCGSAVLAASLVSDRLYYGFWTFPPLRFLHFNLVHSLAVFYGKNRPDYYLTEALPLLLTTALPFALMGLWDALRTHPTHSVSAQSQQLPTQRVLSRLAVATLVMTAVLSLISHKEVRFLYPTLPFLHVIAAGPLSNFLPVNAPLSRKCVLFFLVLVNLAIGGYVSQVHQRGVIDVVSYIRHKHEARNHESGAIANTTVGFLMPCHSTPWRSHLVHPHITGWALTCEPPIDIPIAKRHAYLDEADEFYLSPGPIAWLRDNMESTHTIKASGSRSGQHWLRQDPKFKRKYRREWPANLVFFAQLEDTMKEVLEDTRYKECWRGFNSHWHDDWRRKGDVIVWCLDE